MYSYVEHYVTRRVRCESRARYVDLEKR